VRPQLMRRRHSDALVSFAGPATNLGLFFVFAVLYYFLGGLGDAALLLFKLGALLNMVLFIFNMLPIPGFDGFSILSSFFPRLREFNSEWMTGIYFIMFFLIFFSFEYLWLAADSLLDLLLYGMQLVFG
jgi:Zn-dependent protease